MHDTAVVSNLPGANVCNATNKYCIPPLGDTFGVGRCDRLLIYRSLRLVLFGASGRSTNTQTRCLSPEISPEKIAPSEEYIYRTFVYFNSISVSLYFIYIKLYRIILLAEGGSRGEESSCGSDRRCFFCFFSAPSRSRSREKSWTVNRVSTTSWSGSMTSEDRTEPVVIKCVFVYYHIVSLRVDLARFILSNTSDFDPFPFSASLVQSIDSCSLCWSIHEHIHFSIVTRK